MQNFVNFYSQTIRTKNEFYLHAGDVKFSFVDVRDVAAVAVKLLTKNGSQHDNKAYVLSGQEALSYTQGAEILSKETGKKISYIDIPEEDARKGLKASILSIQNASSGVNHRPKTKKVTLIADEKILQVAPASTFFPGGILIRQ